MEYNGSAVWWCKGHLSTEGEQDVEVEERHLKNTQSMPSENIWEDRETEPQIMVLMLIRCWTWTKSTETFICDIM